MRLPRSRMIARWWSIVLHPFVMVGVMVGTAAAARQTAGEALRSVLIVMVVTMVPLAALMIHQVRRGTWDNVDASHRAERPILYLVGGAALVVLLAYLLVLRPHSFMLRGAFATLVMLAACALATKWSKVSLHMAFATLAATALALSRSPVGYALLMALPVLAWSRLTLERHTPAEVILGMAIGVAAGAAIHYV